jgi:hypothetical protein
MDETTARGVADCTRPLGSPGSTAVWETWRNAGSEVFLSNGAEPPEWQDNSLPDEKPGQVPGQTIAAAARRPGGTSSGLRNPARTAGNVAISNAEALDRDLMFIHGRRPPAGGPSIMFAPDGIFNGQGGFGETRMNRTTYDFIRDNCLFSVQGLQRYSAAIAAGRRAPISFPVESIEVKAAWIDLARENIPQDRWRTYYSAMYQGRHYGLAALHIITKDLPNWFWASFHHVDNPTNPYEGTDSYGPPAALRNTVWENYRLGGTQADFITPTGAPTILSDHYVEFGFQRSSCITCHATAAMSPTGPMPSGLQRSLCALNGAVPGLNLDAARCRRFIGSDAYRPGTDVLVSERGAPDPHWFEDSNGRPYYLQTDFVYAIPARAQNEQQPPPARCILR